jgi:hypothetical protein
LNYDGKPITADFIVSEMSKHIPSLAK